jgi:hypothetical protein
MVIAANNNYVVASVMSAIFLYLTSIICQPTLFFNNKAHVIHHQPQSMKILCAEYGCNFKKAYQMLWKSFKKLNGQISPHIGIEPRVSVPNGPFHLQFAWLLPCAILLFAGGSMLDITISHGISCSE